MKDVSITYQSHRAGHPDMVNQLWHVSWTSGLGNSFGCDFPHLGEALPYALSLITNVGFIVVKDDEGQTIVYEVSNGEIHEPEQEDNQRRYENMYEAERQGFC